MFDKINVAYSNVTDTRKISLKCFPKIPANFSGSRKDEQWERSGGRFFFPKRGNIREAVGMWLQHSKVGLTWETPNMGTAQLLLLWILRFCTSEAEEWLYTCAVRRDLHCILRWWKKGEMCCSYETALTFLLVSLLFFRAAGLRARWPAGDRSRWRQHGCYWMSPPRKPAQGSGSLQRQTGMAGNIQR